MNGVSDEQLFIIMQYLSENGVDKNRVKNAADAFYTVKKRKALEHKMLKKLESKHD